MRADLDRQQGISSVCPPEHGQENGLRQTTGSETSADGMEAKRGIVVGRELWATPGPREHSKRKSNMRDFRRGRHTQP